MSVPTRASTFPTDPGRRKQCPVASGVLDYFPDALIAIAETSYIANAQHNPGEPLHWAREKSTDDADALIRHFLERGIRDSDGLRHSAKMAWRALALLQKEIEAEAAHHENDATPTPAATGERSYRRHGTPLDMCGMTTHSLAYCCSLAPGHDGPHIAFANHVVGTRVLDEWS